MSVLFRIKLYNVGYLHLIYRLLLQIFVLFGYKVVRFLTPYFGTWPSTVTPSTDQTLHHFVNLFYRTWLHCRFWPYYRISGGFHRTFQRVRLANRGRLLLRTSGTVPFGTCICSNVETILSWTWHVYGPLGFRTSLGTYILPFCC